MIKEIVKDREFLSLPAEPATAEDAQVAEDLKDTMTSLEESCASLAANQIGSRKAIIAYEREDGRICVMFNPKLTAFMQPFKATEACLSIEEETEVRRFRVITVAYEALVDGKLVANKTKLRDWTAEIVQHALDHLAGKVI